MMQSLERKAWAALACALVLIATIFPTTLAQDGGDSAAADHAPFLYVVDSRVDPTVARIWSTAVIRTAEAHARHEQGSVWAAFRALTGGPQVDFRFAFPLQKLGDLDGRQSNRQIVVEALGADLGKRVLKELERDSESTDRLMALSPGLSRPAAGPSQPAKYLWTARVSVDKGKMIEYASLIRRVKKAHDAHERGMHWLSYGNAIGGDRNEVLYVLTFERFAEIDGWPQDGEVLQDLLGEREAERLTNALTAISRTTSRIWTLVPEMSRIP